MLAISASAVLVATTAVSLAFYTLASPFEAPHGLGASQARSRCDRASFARLLPAHATLESIAVVRENGNYGEGAADIPYPRNPTNLPALCAVIVGVRSSSSSSYRFGLFLPDDWNSRFLVVGNGGFAGGINWLDMAAGPRIGMASLSTDTGHSGGTTDSTWALNQPERRTDWGWRAIHGSTVLGKRLVSAYYVNKPLRYSYYSGCSTGGRQGLKELQASPDSFDGALIGAPAWWTSHTNTYVAQIGLYNLPVTDPKHLSLSDISLLADEVTRQCDGADGVMDGIVSSPELCTLNLTTLLCSDSKNNNNNNNTNPNPSSPKCLTAAQISTAEKVYSDYYFSEDHTLLHPGLTPGSEQQWYLLLNGTEPTPFGVGYVRNFLYNNPAWDWHAFNESVTRYAEKTDPGNATADDYAALATVRERGGKVILYHGLADGLVHTRLSEVYYNRTVAALGGRHRGKHSKEGLADFFRMFLIPGMLHCLGSAVDAPWAMGGASQAGVLGAGVRSVPGFEDAEHDALLALFDWVEKGRAVESIVATAWRSPLDPTSGVKRQRPVCAWPKKAVWDGVGSVDDAASWRCSR
ncbi:putative feruloyl esterase B-2 [Achaetomium macrosporum]|uniref:Carboxylic ester hydrolase n=1 Tax=Achaetomium macrosporum TaxID=79813 RepID=A0AAN7C7X3_9PEZI|nr:putative feruloyl esterase B-2 [Achaetomium macrosporum]